MAVTRNRLIYLWLGSMACELGIFPLMAIDSIKFLVLDAVCALTVCWFGAACAASLLHSRLEQHIQQTLQSRDITGLGCWIDTIFSPVSKRCFPQTSKAKHTEARASLVEQLPLLTEDTACMLNANERHHLYKKTLSGDDTELMLVVLRILPVLGDASALPFVQRLAEGKGSASDNAELQAEAQSSLARLQASIASRSGAQGLLRASKHPQTLQEHLLLPAQANSRTEAQELMRADVQQ